MFAHAGFIVRVLADIGDLVVLMAKRRYIQNDNNGDGGDEMGGAAMRRVVSINQKLICHVFESEEVRTTGRISAANSVLFRLNRLLTRSVRRSKSPTWSS